MLLTVSPIPVQETFCCIIINQSSFQHIGVKKKQEQRGKIYKLYTPKVSLRLGEISFFR